MSAMALTFDTLQYAKKLQQVGFTAEQAEVQAEALQERTKVINDWIDSNLATKQDLKFGLEKLSYQLTIRLGSMIEAAIAILGILIPLMLRFVR